MKKGILYIIIVILLCIIAYLCYDKNSSKNTEQIIVNENLVDEAEDTFQRGLECQELLNKYKTEKTSSGYVLVGGFYSPVKKTCIGYYMDTSEPVRYQIDDLLGGLTSYYIIYDPDFCGCQSDFLGGAYQPTRCDRHNVQPQRDKEINWLKGIGEKPEL